jgi:hypothetical protein
MVYNTTQHPPPPQVEWQQYTRGGLRPWGQQFKSWVEYTNQSINFVDHMRQSPLTGQF